MVHQVALDAEDVAIRRLSHDDLEAALVLSAAAGWNQRADDWRMIVDLAPAGSFAACAGDRVVATAVGIDYGAFSWVAMMLVDPAYRGRGLGRRLLQAALDAVPDNTPVRLDATPMGRPLYQSCGFEDEVAITRWEDDAQRSGVGARARLKAGATGAGVCAVRSMTETDLPTLADHDREVFGANRRTVLAWALLGAPEYAFVIEPGSPGAPVQYCLGRRGRLFDQVGPVVAVSQDVARRLADAALAAARGPVVMDVLDAQGGFADWLQSCGFRAQRPLFRMRRRPKREQGRLDHHRPEPGLRGFGESADAFAKAEGRRQEGPDRPTALVQFAILGPDFA